MVDILDRFGCGEIRDRVIEVTGDPGIGKTALLTEFAKVAEARGAVVRAGWSGGRSDGASGYALLQAVGAPHQGAAGASHDEVRELLEDLADPVLVVILDDLHLADHESVDLLAHLVRQPPRRRCSSFSGTATSRPTPFSGRPSAVRCRVAGWPMSTSGLSRKARSDRSWPARA
ncbi:AAA family ATPase [Actinomadura sp. NEAU-AAG7]|nr:AAA family ATPase [Actinomadura sp. NEAU-AAG7]